MKKSLTIHDIAKMAEVSSATVSRVLSNSSYPVSPELRSKILRIAKEANYVPNMLGKQLKTKTSMTIGVIIPTITNTFYSSVILGVEEIARKNNYQVLLCNSFQDPVLEDKYIQAMFEKQVRGLVISSISSDKKQLKHFIDMGLNVVALDQKVEMEEVCQVDFDYRKGGVMATRHLISKGHKKIAYVTAPLDRPSRVSIYDGYASAMKEAGLEPVVVEAGNETYSGTYEFENGKALTRKLLAGGERPSAVFACNDMTAFGVVNELNGQGFKVPDDVSVMGFDGIDFGQMITPPLSTVLQPTYEMGRLACNMLLDMLIDGKKPDIGIMLQPKLLERESVADLRG
ncbi:MULTISPECIES: LacI family DNA-binding transcriptional regulator [Paenibacillus]|jgi:LacI family transcriptional regulator|uniref:LacI family DNA-binding transcriptional regulator n=1 Tax=Paenibacillus oceani TaxID=2772510 RepID=A0A927CC02_9BACL|nr:LacI family DNA-binding transcriptional regulator [Paenibacillus oceani]MBD2865259.1 LacI family DNA-binding transcriptional regulator [Paenibacillus oceani]